MAKYIETAGKANTLILDVISRVPDAEKRKVSLLLGEIYNLGIRTAPRPTQSTVRYRAVQEAMKGTNVVARLIDDKDKLTGKEFKRLELTAQE